jgi:hypothetical protein
LLASDTLWEQGSRRRPAAMFKEAHEDFQPCVEELLGMGLELQIT